MGLPFLILSYVLIPIDKSFPAISMFKRSFKLTLINTVFMLVNSLSMLPIQEPTTFIWITFRRLPYTMSVFRPQFPISFKNLSIIPQELAVSMPHTIDELSDVHTVNVSFTTWHFDTIFVNTLENLLRGNKQGFTMFLIITLSLTKI